MLGEELDTGHQAVADALERVAVALRARNIEALIVETGDEAGQKVVPDLEAAIRRIHDVVFPYENAQVRARLGVDTVLEKILIMYGEWQAGRTTVVLVREPVGV